LLNIIVEAYRSDTTKRKTTKMQITTSLLFAILITVTFIQATEIKTVTANTTASESESSTNSIPAYAFNGAYVTYTLNDYLDRKVTFTISEVDVASQTFKVSWTFIGSWNFPASNEIVSFASISPIPNNTSKSPFSAASFADIQILNKGEIPADMPAGVVVNSNLSVYVLGGYHFNADEVQMPSNSNSTDNSSFFVDMHSGLTVVADFDENGAAWGIAYGQLSLINTNVPMTVNVRASPSPSPSVPVFSNQTNTAAAVGVAVAVVVCAGLLVYFKKRKPKVKI
jgi:hypothetical protein